MPAIQTRVLWVMPVIFNGRLCVCGPKPLREDFRAAAARVAALHTESNAW